VSERSRTDELRSARLLLGPDVASDTASSTAGAEPGAELLRSRAVRAAVRSRPLPSAPVRFLQRVQRKRGKLDYERAVVDPMEAARSYSAPPRRRRRAS
jgi:hypothetical protein